MQKVGGILAKPAPNKGKTITSETLHLVTNVYEDDNSRRYLPKKKDYVNVSKGVHKQKLCNPQNFFVICKIYILLSKKNTQM